MNAVTPNVETILAQAVEIAEPAQRHAFVEQACHGDEELQRRVERLMANHFQAGSFLERPAVVVEDASTAGWQRDESAHELGTLIGPYKLLEQIGEGGMGLVYVAEQQQPLKRRVALKIIKPGMDSKQVIARFEAERQALALMDHPHIAKVHDAGTTAEGRPYFVMELVKGRLITEYCDEHRLTTRQRLELFLDVCQAVQHAHQKGIIHRDLKPSNVLVEVHDVRPVVKVIDFGIAKATGPQLTDKTLYTGLAQLLGTPLYMSPEQAGLSSLDVDTRSDVYSLGVLLYELLTGTTPFDSETLKKAGYDEMRRIIREDDPPRPSGRLSTLAQAHLSTIAQRRGLEPRRLSQQVRGELDWIVMKALEKDRNRRYESASAFAADVQRYLKDEPVQACPPSQLYRLGKFARRHKGALGVAAGLVLAAVLAAGGGLWWVQQRTRVESEARAALQEANAWQQQERWHEALSAARRAEALLAGVGADTRLRHEAEESIKDSQMAVQLQEAKLRGTAVKNGYFDDGATRAAYAEAFQNYGLDVDHLDPQQAAEQIRARSIHQELVAALDDWAVLSHTAQEWHQRLAVARLADPDPWRNRLRDCTDTKDPKTLEEVVTAAKPSWPMQTLVLLARIASFTDASERVVGVLAQAQQRRPNDFWINEQLAIILAQLKPRTRRLEEEIRFASIAVALRPKSPGAHLNLGVSLQDKGRLDNAIAEFRQAIQLRPDYAEAHSDLGEAFRAKGQLDEAIAESREAIRLKPKDALVHYNLGGDLRDKGRFDEAIAEYHQAIQLKPSFAEAHSNLGVVLADKGRLDEAIAECREAIRLKPDYAQPHINLGADLAMQLRLNEAIAEYRRAIRLKPDNAAAHANLGHVLRDTGRPDEAIAECRQAIRLNPNFAEAHATLGFALSDKGRLEEAVREFREAIALKPDFARPQRGLAQLLQRRGEYQAALACLKEAIRLKPGYAEGQSDLAWLLATCPDIRFRDPAQALIHARKATELQPGRRDMANTLGVVFYRNGAWQEAVKALRKSMQLSRGGDSNDYFFLAMAHWQLGEKDKARAWYERGVAWMDKHNPQDEESKRFRAEAAALLGVGKAAKAPLPKR